MMGDTQGMRLVIQARMGSQRLPRKSLALLRGRPLLDYVLDSLLQVASRNSITLATSEEPENEPLLRWAEERHISAFQGSESNVASRFATIFERSDANWLVRINGDSPLLDHRIVAEAMESATRHPSLIVSTVPSKTFPSGTHVEVIPRRIFLEHYKRFSEPSHFEHVTSYFYEPGRSVDIATLTYAITEASGCKLSVDTPADLIRVEKILAAIGEPHWRTSLAERCAAALRVK